MNTFSLSKTNLSRCAVVLPHENVSFPVCEEAGRLVKEIEAVAGKKPPLLTDADAPRAVSILISDMNDEMEADAWTITPDGGKLLVKGGRPWACLSALRTLRSLLKEGSPVGGLSGKASGGRGRSWKLTWCDDFVGNEINADAWDVFDGERGRSKGKKGLTSYRRAANCTVAGSKLSIAATHDDNGWYGGMLRSWNRVLWKYGYVEISAKIPDGKGYWTAFWMCSQGGELLNQEIDVYECFGSANRIAGNVHRWPTSAGKEKGLTHTSLDGKRYGAQKRIVLPEGQSFGDAFHTYGYLWDEKGVTFTCDGAAYFHYDFADDAEANALACHNPLYFILSQAVAFDNPVSAEPDETNDWEHKNSLVIDYIALYQKPGQELILKKPE